MSQYCYLVVVIVLYLENRGGLYLANRGVLYLANRGGGEGYTCQRGGEGYTCQIEEGRVIPVK
jgi:hypothetical protein